MKRIVYQAQEKGCGFAAVKMALIFASGDARYANEPEPIVSEAPDLAHLISYGAEYGLSLCAYHVADPHELTQNAEYPLLLLLREEIGLHVVVLVRKKRNRYLIFDPARGKRWEKESRILARWNGVFLRIEGYEEKSEHSFSSTFLLSIPSWRTLAALALLPMVLITLGLLLLDLSLSPMWALGCFAASLALSMVQKAHLLRAMVQFDHRYMDGIDAKSLTRRKELFVHYHAYKRAVFHCQSEVLGRLVLLITALVFLLFHDLYLALLGAFALGLTALFSVLFGPFAETLELRASELEHRYLNGLLDEEGRRKLRRELQLGAREYGKLMGAAEVSSVGLSIVLTVGFAALQANFSPQILIFYFMTAFTFIGQTRSLFLGVKALQQKKREEAYFRLNIASKAHD